MKDKRCGEKINQRRKEKGLKVDELADLCHIKPGYMRQILSGDVPSLSVLVNICRVLHITTDYIFEITDESGKDEQIISRINKLTPKQKNLLLHLLDSFNEFEQGDMWFYIEQSRFCYIYCFPLVFYTKTNKLYIS